MQCPFPEVTEAQNRQTESKTERDRDRERLFLTAQVCLDVLYSAPLHSWKRDEGWRFQERNKLTMKSRGRSRGWLSATKERVVGEEFKRGCDGSLHWQVAERQAGEVQSILRQKGTLGLWNIHSSQLETETQSDRAEEAPEDWRDSTSPPKHSLLKIKHTDTFLMTSHEEPRGK